MRETKLEIACFNLESALIAQENGADRVELCANRNDGGTTPNFETIQEARTALSIPLMVMIRPRAGDFVYSDTEFHQMKTDLIEFKKLKVDGFVFGILNKDASINHEQNTELLALAHPLPCTFHRAFDEVNTKEEALEVLIRCGFKTILTSGLEQNAVDGLQALSELIQKANNRIIIMPGGGIRAENIKLLSSNTKASFYHSSAIIDEGEIADKEEIKALKANLKMASKSP